MIKKILIANRGEIACRIARTCSKLGIKTVAIYSDADADALHVHACDEAAWVGESESSASYLNATRIIEIAKETGADAIHPGYGFLSENSAFARAVQKAGLTFIGPSPEVIELLGDKVAAKKIADKVSAPTIQGVSLESLDLKPIDAFVNKNGFPILIKAAAGGGGRGMRKVYRAEELTAALESASREAKSFFGDGRVFIEQLIEDARHIEVQILGDSHGAVMHIGTRDCSFQRNHQKVIEEAPAPHIPDHIRNAIHTAAINICREVKYANAGTVEFLLKGESFYFLEVNSRLQVEHPVTEEVYGVDLVELQIQIAAGKKLSDLLPHTVQPNGHAIQCRICTELPRYDFQSDTGLIHECIFPADVRVDTGYGSGLTVSHYYDSLFAKLIVHNTTRIDAIIDALQALEATHIAGVQTNIEFLISLLLDESFHTVSHHTYAAHDVLDAMKERKTELFVALGTLIVDSFHSRFPDFEPDGFRITSTPSVTRQIKVGSSLVSLKAQFTSNNRILLPSYNLEVTYSHLYEDTIELSFEEENCRITAKRYGDIYWTSGSLGNFVVSLTAERLKRESSSKGSHTGEVRSSLPGKILSLKVSEGDSVEVGTPLLILESMKMEHNITAPNAGLVEALSLKVGSTVTRDQLLCRIKP